MTDGTQYPKKFDVEKWFTRKITAVYAGLLHNLSRKRVTERCVIIREIFACQFLRRRVDTGGGFLTCLVLNCLSYRRSAYIFFFQDYVLFRIYWWVFFSFQRIALSSFFFLFSSYLMVFCFVTRRVFGYSTLLASILTLLTPGSAAIGFGWIVAVRVLLGFLLGATWPAILPMASKWIPPMDRSKFMSNMMGKCS